MTTSTLSTRVDEYLWSALRTGVTAVSNRVYVDDSAPGNAAYPLIQFSMLSGLGVPVLEGTRILGRFVYIVQAIARSGTWDSVEAAADQIYTALHQQTGSTAEIEILSCLCEEEIRRAEAEEGGTRFRYLGWRVRLEVVAA